MTKTCCHCGKKFNTKNCETYTSIQYKICRVGRPYGHAGEYTLCADCEDHFNTFVCKISINNQTDQN